MWLDTLQEKHYRALYEITRRVEPYNAAMLYEQFSLVMSRREGFVVVALSGELAGCISFSDYVPGGNIVIHCTIDEKYQRRWCTKKILREVYSYIFGILDLPRVSGFCIVGVSDKAGEFHLALGGKYEGTIRKGALLPDGLYDVNLYGMLKEECRWI